MLKGKTARTLPQQVASTLARYQPISDWDLLRQVVENYYNITFDRRPENIADTISVVQHLPTVEQIGRARRTAEKKGLVKEWKDFYDSPTREAERIKQEFSNIPIEYEEAYIKDEL